MSARAHTHTPHTHTHTHTHTVSLSLSHSLTPESEKGLSTQTHCRLLKKTVFSWELEDFPVILRAVRILSIIIQLVISPEVDCHKKIEGGDCGLGHALCKYLDELGFTVFAGVLNENGPGAEELRRTCSPRLSVLQMDVTKPVQIKDAYSKVAAMLQDRGLWAVVNNAGVLGFPSDGELLPMTDYKQCMAVNFFGTVEVTKTFLPLLRKSKGRLVNVSSMGGGAPMAKLASYGSSKAAVTMFSSVMRIELSKWGIKVVSIQPGGFRTSIAGTSDKWEKLEKDILDHLPAEVQEDYGQDYILSQRNFLLFINSEASTDFSPVLRDIQHAISAKSPFAYYTPGKGAYLWLCLAFYLPIGIYNYLIERNFGKDKPMPRALSMPNYKRKAT
ncbi:estradiol 17-beta-dehydrogenase 2 isoform X2 [Trachypithecus francoisi]|uniref:estradiol 17-beta-dehydrogenase 2 isoform X2 n=1 Tax=Trachypithecus francoisi TaxID=54180 RepID=UPI00141BF342|nr:estradiol 17-beta-dehydrogenase 2 isoform X2 [Trachypithecus francoisi]